MILAYLLFCLAECVHSPVVAATLRYAMPCHTYHCLSVSHEQTVLQHLVAGTCGMCFCVQGGIEVQGTWVPFWI